MQAINPFHTTHTTYTAPSHHWPELIAFFYKTPPPPCDRRPMRFNQREYFRQRRPFDSSNRNSHRAPWLHPKALQRSHHRPRKVCFGCKREGLFLCDCPQCNRYGRRFQFFCDIADAAPYFLSNDEQELDENAAELLAYFSDAEAYLVENDNVDKADDALDA